MNNFQQLQQLQEEEFHLLPKDYLRDNIYNSLRTIRFIGQVVDLYLPRVMDVIVSASSSETEDEAANANEKKHNSDPASDEQSQAPPDTQTPPA